MSDEATTRDMIGDEDPGGTVPTLDEAAFIKKAKRSKHVSTRGMDPKFLRNLKFAKKYNGTKRVHE